MNRLATRALDLTALTWMLVAACTGCESALAPSAGSLGMCERASCDDDPGIEPATTLTPPPGAAPDDDAGEPDVPTRRACSSESACDDGEFCNGVERCV